MNTKMETSTENTQVTENQESKVNRMYENLFQKGKLVHITVTKCRMNAPLKEENLKIETGVPDIVKLGHILLFSPEVLSCFGSIEGKARRYLKTRSVPFPVAGTHFVRNDLILDTIKTLREYEDEYNAEVTKFGENYETNKTKVQTDNPDLWPSLEPYYPPVQNVISRFSFTTSIVEVSFPNAIEKLEFNQLTADNTAREEANVKYQAQYRLEMERQREAATRNMNAFVGNLESAIVEQIDTMTTRILGKINKSEPITNTNFETIKTSIKNIRNINFLENQSLNAQLTVLENLVDGTRNGKDKTLDVERFRLALVQVQNEGTELGERGKQGKRLRQLDL